MSHFELLTTLSIGTAPLTCYRSKLTNVRVYLAQNISPLVAGYFTLPTEVKDDDGCPHVLEHMIFLGSKDYPTKGVLDSLANRCLSQGTNAWTDTDHTTYTLTTAGKDGFLNLLPIYLDHILRPTLLSDAFFTEVHHFTTEGSSKGVVYCEMEGQEFLALNVVNRAASEALYPEGCGYRYETGGLLENLRKLTIEKVRDYHKQFYCWNNLSIIVSGQCDAESLLKVISKAEIHHTKDMSPDELAKLQSRATHWDSPIPPFVAPSAPIRVMFPSDDEDGGRMIISWRTTSLWSNFEENLATEVLCSYLAESNVAPFHVALVEGAAPWAPVGISRPLCSAVDFWSVSFLQPHVQLALSDVKVDQMKLSGEAVRNLFQLVHTLPLDMKRMGELVGRAVNQMRRMFEVTPHELVAQWLNEFVVNGRGDIAILKKLLDAETTYKKLESMESSYWLDLLKRQFIDSPYVEVHGIPSPKFAEKMQKEEKTRSKEIVSSMGDELKKTKSRVDAILASYAKGPPAELLSLLPVVSPANVPLFDFPEKTNYGADCPSELDASPFPIQFQTLEDSKFIMIRVMARIPDDDDDFVIMAPLLTDLIFSCPTKFADGREVSHEEFTNILSATTTHYRASNGFEGSELHPSTCPELVCVTAVAPFEQAAALIDVLHAAVYNQTITADRVKSLAQSTLAGCAKHRRSAEFLLDQIESTLRFGRSSMYNAGGLGRQQNFLRRLLRNVDDYVPKLQAAYNRLFSSNDRRLMIQISGTINRLPADYIKLNIINDLCRPDLPHAKFDKSIHPRDYLDVTHALKSQIDSRSVPCGPEVILGLASTDSSFLTISIPGPLGEDHPDLPALLVLMEYLGASEGKLYRAVRGGGYAYHVEVGAVTDAGEVYLQIGPASDVIKGLEVSRQNISEFLSSTGPIEELDAAKASTVFAIISKENSLSSYAYQSILMTLNGVSSTHHRTLLSQVSLVESDDVRRVAVKYMGGFVAPFEGGRSTLTVVSNTAKVDGIVMGLGQFGANLKVIGTVDEYVELTDPGCWEAPIENEAEFQALTKGGEGDEEEEGDEEDEEEEEYYEEEEPLDEIFADAAFADAAFESDGEANIARSEERKKKRKF